MWIPSDERDKERSARRTIGENIDKDPMGKRLTPEAREEAITIGVKAWGAAPIGNGDAAQIGIKAVTGKILKK